MVLSYHAARSKPPPYYKLQKKVTQERWYHSERRNSTFILIYNTFHCTKISYFFTKSKLHTCTTFALLNIIQKLFYLLRTKLPIISNPIAPIRSRTKQQPFALHCTLRIATKATYARISLREFSKSNHTVKFPKN